MKTISFKLPSEYYEKIQMRLIEENLSLSSYMRMLLGDPTVNEQHLGYRTISFRVPENEYMKLKMTVLEQRTKIKDFILDAVTKDLNKREICDKFQREDNSGIDKTVSFQVKEDLFYEIKERALDIDLTFQDYMKSVIYAEITMHEQMEYSKELSEEPEMDLSM